MRPGRTFALLLATGFAAFALVTVLALRLLSCLAVGPLCLFASGAIACEGLRMARLDHGAPLLGAGFLLLALASAGRFAWHIWRQVCATRRLARAWRPAVRWRTWRRVRRAARRVGLAGRVVPVADEAPWSACYGLRAPRVVVSEPLVQVLTPRQIEAVLWHERCHLEQRDPLRLLLARALCAALFWLPLLDALRRHFELLIELAADQRAVAMQAGPAGLAGALYRLLAAASPPPRAAVSGLSPTVQRIDYLLGPMRPPRLRVTRQEALGAVALGAVALCILFW